MSIQCKRCNKEDCTYAVPQNYNPQKGIATRSIADYSPEDPIWKTHHIEPLERIHQIYRNCVTIHHKDILYVGSDGQLTGCSRFNLLERIYLLFLNYWNNGENERKTVKKIEETFNYILQIGRSLKKNDQDFRVIFTPTYLQVKKQPVSFVFPYTVLANKILANYPKQPSLKELSVRIIHERPRFIPSANRQKQPNIKENAKDTPWESTTIWDREPGVFPYLCAN